jgi:ubiquinone/menaquinone biosynthesis C-methylase UbiE
MEEQDMNERGARGERKFDPAKAGKLEDPERQRFLPHDRLVELLDLSGGETVVDYGAGTGAVAIALGERLRGGKVFAVEENPEMARLLEERLSDTHDTRVSPLVIRDNQVPLPDGAADRVLAVNLLHEVVGESALAEMRRLLSEAGLLLVVDWDSEVERDQGPPSHIALSPHQGRAMLEEAGFYVESVPSAGFPYHYALLARKR